MSTATTQASFSYRPILIGTLFVLLAMGTRATFGLFMQPMGLHHGWSRDVFSMAFALQNITWGLGAIAAGMMADRFGSGRTVALAAFLYAMGLLGTRFASTELELYLTAGLLVGLGQAGTTFAVILPVIARTVPVSYRSTAMGIASAGGSLGQFLVVPTGQVLIDTLDWTGAYWVLSFFLAAAIPLAWYLRGKPDGSGIQLSLRQAIKQALTHSSFHFLFWSYFVCGFHTAFITLHLPAFVVDEGLSASTGAIAIALIGLFNVFGSYWAGRLGGTYSKKNLLGAVYALRIVGMLWLMFMPISPLVVYVFAAWMGLFWLGTVPLTQGLIAQIYGLRYAATLSGMVFLGHQVGSFVGVWLGGKVQAVTGSYDIVWWIGIALALIAGALCLPIREKPLVAPAVQPA
ncbi:MFS transporter [Orrella daihaiensis]|uniref:MFS transporter n=1 Tax=Orrella daihaiensis TaxID=2782176 RepID=A0ABY4AI17_9BURK|nr:MFS transporter [Orrella daihaiensis]UOD49934.1 MFS transporter [Orrella daihaiensis]